jgi:hypothetical protein
VALAKPQLGHWKRALSSQSLRGTWSIAPGAAHWGQRTARPAWRAATFLENPQWRQWKSMSEPIIEKQFISFQTYRLIHPFPSRYYHMAELFAFEFGSWAE